MYPNARRYRPGNYVKRTAPEAYKFSTDFHMQIPDNVIKVDFQSKKKI